MTWTRRSFLSALGASAAAPALAHFVAACTAPATQTPLAAPTPVGPVAIDAGLRQILRQLVAELSQRFVHASALATVRHTGHVVADAGAHSMHRDLATAVVLQVETSAGRFEQVTTGLDAAQIARAAQTLRDRAAAGYQANRPPRPLGRARDSSSSLTIDPQTIPPGQWIERVRQLYERGRRVGGSRIVYRGAYLSADDISTLYVGNGRDLSQRLVRTRAGVVLVAQRQTDQGAAPMAEVAENHGLMGLEATDVDTAALEAAADRVLALVTPAAPPAGDTALVLAPGMAALLAHRCVGPALDGRAWLAGAARAAAFMGQPVGSELVTITDDPTLAGAWGSYFFDDEGQPGAAHALIDRGVLRGPYTDSASAAALGTPATASARRPSPEKPLAPALSNLTVAPGSLTRKDLIGAVDRGLLLEGGLAAHTDLGTWRFAGRAARGYEIAGGKLTGVLYGDVDIQGDVPALLRAVQGVSAEIERAPSGASTMAAPYLLTRARVV